MTDYHHSNKSSNILHKIYGNNMKFDIKLTRDFLLEKLLEITDKLEVPFLLVKVLEITDNLEVL